MCTKKLKEYKIFVKFLKYLLLFWTELELKDPDESGKLCKSLSVIPKRICIQCLGKKKLSLQKNMLGSIYRPLIIKTHSIVLGPFIGMQTGPKVHLISPRNKCNTRNNIGNRKLSEVNWRLF